MPTVTELLTQVTTLTSQVAQLSQDKASLQASLNTTTVNLAKAQKTQLEYISVALLQGILSRTEGKHGGGTNLDTAISLAVEGAQKLIVKLGALDAHSR